MADLFTAIEENLHEHVSFVQRRVAGMVVDDQKDLLLVDSRLPTDTFNKILRARLDESTADRRIREGIAYFRNAERPFAWWVGPCSQPSDLGLRLERHGLQAAEFERGMAMDLDALPRHVEMPADLRIKQVTTSQELADFTTVVAGDPPDQAILDFFQSASPIVLQAGCPMQFFVGYMNGVPAASAELFTWAGLAGIHMISTREPFQRRGVGLAMTWAAASEGLRRGASMAALQASEQGQRVYTRLGFTFCCEFVEYR